MLGCTSSYKIFQAKKGISRVVLQGVRKYNGSADKQVSATYFMILNAA